jgi:hypothetical protein
MMMVVGNNAVFVPIVSQQPVILRQKISSLVIPFFLPVLCLKFLQGEIIMLKSKKKANGNEELSSCHIYTEKYLTID